MNMFKPTSAKTPADYIAQLSEPRKSEITKLHQLIRKNVPRLKPHIQSGMIGYGTYHYKYESGREGDWFIIGLASRKQYISLYVNGYKDGKSIAEHYKSELPAADIGKSCVRIKKLEDVKLPVIATMIRETAKLMQQAAK